ncbi:MAG TPA: hypothetical protein VI139_00045 [Gemmatimonadales bacterium]
MSIRLLALIPVAVAINLALSAAVDAVNLPLFLDTTGTILATALAGPVVGVTTGVLTSLTNSFRNPTYLPFVAVQVLVALYAWFAARAGLFRNLKVAVPAGPHGAGSVQASAGSAAARASSVKGWRPLTPRRSNGAPAGSARRCASARRAAPSQPGRT